MHIAAEINTWRYHVMSDANMRDENRSDGKLQKTDDLQTMLTRYCCPPGNGVYTVHAGEELREPLQARLYPGVRDANAIVDAWRASFATEQAFQKPLILGVCSDAGGGILRGANWGPLAIRQALYDRIDVNGVLDLGDIRVIPQLLLDSYLNDDMIARCRSALYGDAASAWPVSPLSITEEVMRVLYQELQTPRVLSLGGDHSISYPLVKQFLLTQRAVKKRAAVLQFDAHTDLLNERLGIPICFGSWTYHVLPYLQSPSDLIQIGIRSTGHDKAYWEREIGIQQHWADEVKAQGAASVASRIIDYLNKNGIEDIYISFDIDALDSGLVQATGTPEPNGLNVADCLEMINVIGDAVKIVSADIAEVAPFVQHTGAAGAAGEERMEDRTVEYAAMIAETLLLQLRKI